MSNVNLPLSGGVYQSIMPWTNNFYVTVGNSTNPDTEKSLLDVASYGKQLGRIGDAVLVLLKHMDQSGWPHEDQTVINDLKAMLHELAKAKHAAGSTSVVWPKMGA